MAALRHGNVIELEVARRDGNASRSRLLGLLRVGGRWYIGHPNGPVGWTEDLEAAGEGALRWPHAEPIPVRAHRLAVGPERESAIIGTGQHPFPGNLVYRLGRRHVRAVGVFLRLDQPEAAE